MNDYSWNCYVKNIPVGDDVDHLPRFLKIGGEAIKDANGDFIVTNNRSWKISIPFGNFLEGFTAWRFPKRCMFCNKKHNIFYEEQQAGAVYCLQCTDSFGLNKV